jgi:hypothetical protein
MQVGDLVRLKGDGGVGIILAQRRVYSNIATGVTTKQLVQWIEPPRFRSKHRDKSHYFVAYLELLEPTVKKCPSK